MKRFIELGEKYPMYYLMAGYEDRQRAKKEMEYSGLIRSEYKEKDLPLYMLMQGYKEKK